MITRFISVSSYSIFAVMLCIINFRFNIISIYGVVLCYYKKGSNFSFKVSLSEVCPSLIRCNIISLLLEISTQMFFFLFLFARFSFFLFVVMLPVLLLAVVISLSLFFLMKSSGPCVDAFSQSSILPPSFLDLCNLSSPEYKAWCIVITFLALWCIRQLLLLVFSHQLMLMVFNCSLSDRKSPQVHRTLLSICCGPGKGH